MKSIKLVFKYHGKFKLLSFSASHTCYRFVDIDDSMDDQMEVKDIAGAMNAISLLTNKKIKHTSNEETSEGTLYYYEVELPLSDDGKYMLIKNPFPQ